MHQAVLRFKTASRKTISCFGREQRVSFEWLEKMLLFCCAEVTDGFRVTKGISNGDDSHYLHES